MAVFNFVNLHGKILSLSDSKNFKLVNFDSQTAASTNISSLTTGDMDGDIVNNIQAQARTIVIDLRIVADVEKTKRQILDVVKLKQQASIEWTQNNRTLAITGVVEAIDMPRWTNSTMLQITMHCGQPFWETIDDLITEISEAINLHYFTDIVDDMLYFPEEGIAFGEYDVTRKKTFNNAGDVDVGLLIEIVAYRTVTNPIIYAADGSYFGCGYGTANKQVVMQAGDVIVINTNKNEKAVTLNGVSILGKIKPNSTWLQLAAGTNEFSINSDEEVTDNMTFSLIYKERYI